MILIDVWYSWILECFYVLFFVFMVPSLVMPLPEQAFMKEGWKMRGPER